MDAPTVVPKCRRQQYRAVAAELIFSNKSPIRTAASLDVDGNENDAATNAEPGP
jgi:hypothetical protein